MTGAYVWRGIGAAASHRDRVSAIPSRPRSQCDSTVGQGTSDGILPDAQLLPELCERPAIEVKPNHLFDLVRT